MSWSDLGRDRLPLADAVAIANDLLRNTDSALAWALNGGEQPWSRTEYLLAHLWQAFTGDPHPALPKDAPRRDRDPKRQAALNRAKDRAAERRRLIEAGEIT